MAIKLRLCPLFDAPQAVEILPGWAENKVFRAFSTVCAMINRQRKAPMNIIAPNRPVSKISVEERARRKAAIDYARGSVRLEGFVLPSAGEKLYSQFIDGEITSDELRAAVLEQFKL